MPTPSRLLLISAIGVGLLASCTRPESSAPPVPTVPIATTTPATAAAFVPAATAAEATTCERPFGLAPSAELTYQLLNEKRKPVGLRVVKVASITPHEAEKKKSAYTEMLLKSTEYDAANRPQGTAEYVYICRNDTVLTDGRLLLDPSMLRSFRDRRFAYEPRHLAWPNQPTAGALPGGQLTVQISSPSVDIAKVITTVSQRQLSGPESVTVPAGTFQCYRVDSRYEYITQAREDLSRRIIKRVAEYYAPGVGIVRTEMRDADGELDRVAELLRRTAGNQ